MIIVGVDRQGTVVCIVDAITKVWAENFNRRREDVAVIMTRPLYERLNLEIFGYKSPPYGAKKTLSGCDVRVMEGDTEEWYIAAKHGYTPTWHIEDGKTVETPPIKLQEEPHDNT